MGTTLSLTQEEIGQMPGVTRETVTRSLGEFQERGLVVLKGKTILISNRGDFGKARERKGGSMAPNELNAHAAELSCRAHEIGHALREFGTAFASSYWKFEVKDEEIVGRMRVPELKDVKPVVLPLAYLDKANLVRLIRDIEATG